MPLQCIACRRPTGEEQPYYCEQCFIPVPPYKDHDYTGSTLVNCPSCNTQLEDRETCHNCGTAISANNPPKPGEMSQQMKVRVDNRAALAQQVLADSRMTQQMIELLGIDHMPREQQGVALTALAREKMHFLSVEYNFGEARTLVDMGYAITDAVGIAWASQIAGLRLATYYYRAGIPMQAADILYELYQDAPSATEIEKFRRLEILARLALAHRLAGNAAIAETMSGQAHEQLLSMFQDMEPEINKLIRDDLRRSHMMGLEESQVSYPRVDYVFTIAAILTEEVIARGASGELRVSDLAIDRMLELDNLIRILAEMTPLDDPGYFASHLREYVRLASGLLWYGEVLLPNSAQRRRLLVERYFQRIRQWVNLVPTQYWLPLRPARFLEVFLRAENWSENIHPQQLVDELFLRSTDEIKPSWHYVLADAYSKVGKLEEAVQELEIITNEQQEYTRGVSDELRSIATNLLSSIQLEIMGIIYGTVEPDTWLHAPISVELEEMDTLKFDAPAEIMQFGIAIFGDRLLQQYPESQPRINSVGSRPYDSSEWNSPPDLGPRMDITIIRTQLTEEQGLLLLFEGKPQELNDDGNGLQPAPLLLLRGLIWDAEPDANQLLNHLVDIMEATDAVQERTKVFILNTTSQRN